MASHPSDEEVARERGLTTGQLRELQLSRGLRNESLRRLPEAALRHALRRLDFPDFPRTRETFRRLQEEDERGHVAEHALANALRQLDSVRARSPVRERVAGVPTGPRVAPRTLLGRPPSRTAGLQADRGGWASLGPGNVGGRTRAVVVDPRDPDRLWAASVGGGVWQSRDGGASWRPVDDFMANLAVTCLAIDPTDPDVVYAGTGEGFSNVDALRGEGVFRTLDGERWEQLPATAGADFRWVNRLALSADGDVLLVATPAGLFRSGDPHRLDFERVIEAEVGFVACHPGDVRKAIAGGLRNGLAWVSSDGGRSWQRSAHDGAWSGRVELTYAAADPRVVYASVEMSHGEVWRSDDGGASYRRRRTLTPEGRPAAYLGDQGWYDNVIWAGDPTDACLVLAGGIDLWRSRDGGDTLEEVSAWWEPRSIHGDQHALTSHPAYDGEGNRVLFVANDGGVYRAEDARTVGGDDGEHPKVLGWRELVNGYGVTQFYGGAGDAESGVIFGGAQDHGTLRFTPEGGSEGWTCVFGGDGGHCAIDPTDPRVVYGAYIHLNLHRSTDGGESAELISGQRWDGRQWVWKPIPYRIPDAMSCRALFIAPFVLDPNQPRRLLGGGLGLWRTEDARAPNSDHEGPAWSSIKRATGSPISALAVAEGDPDLVWVGHANGELYRSRDGTAEHPLWQRRDHQGPSPLAVRRFLTSIVIDPRDPKTVYVTFGGYRRGNVWKTPDGGRSWRNLGGLLPAAPVRSLALHPRREGYLYLGTEVGLFASEDGGSSWSPTHEGPTNCSVDALFWMGEVLVCATHGRGMFTIDLSEV